MVEVLHKQVSAEKDLSRRLEDLAGRWVAVRDHQLVADAETVDELLEKIGSEEVEALFEVVEQGTACFY